MHLLFCGKKLCVRCFLGPRLILYRFFSSGARRSRTRSTRYKFIGVAFRFIVPIFIYRRRCLIMERSVLRDFIRGKCVSGSSLLSLPGTFFAGNCRIDMGVSRFSKGRFKYFTHFVHFHGCTLNSALKWPNESAFPELFQTVSDIAIELFRKVDGARPLAPNRE
jgi:hypothetical protein